MRPPAAVASSLTMHPRISRRVTALTITNGAASCVTGRAPKYAVVTKDRYIKDGHLGDVTDDRVVLLSVSELPPAARRALLDVLRIIQATSAGNRSSPTKSSGSILPACARWGSGGGPRERVY